ncbi:hypothetical protein [Vibrio marisflavi]|uniref:Uncharacterized protein n=1 Tax=Vibrio marisflavi CECT 7928 TaxID=634439 RepID=A0ABN8E8Y5_9VIBR|nr:hypothetical protein [Vibrio marisflavi]CAH0543083.1 hypothetical protein VMF7928_04392 [Vibrio marisflavi CECT 7928]
MPVFRNPRHSWRGACQDIERERPVKTTTETTWRDQQLSLVLNRIDQYEKDQNYPEEYRTSPITSEDEFNSLLMDRKKLCDYPESVDFPFGQRPQLSGVAS